MRRFSLFPALVLAACCAAPALFAEEAPSPRAIEAKMKAMREAVVKQDADLAKFKAQADDARKHYETAVEAKLMEDAAYAELKAQLAQLRAGEKRANKPKEGDKPKVDDKAQGEKPARAKKGDTPAPAE